MAYLQDYEDEQQKAAGGSSAPGASYTPATGESQAPTASSGSGFAPLADYFTANQQGAQDMASGLASGVTDAGKKAVSDWNQDEATAAQSQFQNLGSQDGIATGLAKQYGDPRYSGGMSGLDAYLATRGSGGSFDDLKSKFGGLDWNTVGTPAPDAPVAPTGEAPAAPTLRPRYESNQGQMPGTAAEQSIAGLNVPVDIANREAQQQYDQDKAAYDKSQSDYQTAMGEYQPKKDAWDATRQPFLSAFGL